MPPWAAKRFSQFEYFFWHKKSLLGFTCSQRSQRSMPPTFDYSVLNSPKISLCLLIIAYILRKSQDCRHSVLRELGIRPSSHFYVPWSCSLMYSPMLVRGIFQILPMRNPLNFLESKSWYTALRPTISSSHTSSMVINVSLVFSIYFWASFYGVISMYKP